MNAGFDWKQFERFFNGNMPSVPLSGGDWSKWIEACMQTVLQQSFANAGVFSADARENEWKPEISESDQHVTVRLSVPRSVAWHELSVRAGLNQLVVDGWPDKERKTIVLPAVINARKCRADYKDGELFIKALKLDRNRDFVNVSIRRRES